MSFWKKKPEFENSGPPERKSGDAPLVLGKTGDSGLANKTLESKGLERKLAENAGEKASTPASMADLNPEDILNERFGKTRSALSAGTVIQGKLSFDTPVRIDGKLSGEVYSSKALIIGPTGQVDAQVEVACLVVLGSLKGNAKAAERLEIWAGGAFEGNIVTPVLVVQEGGAFSGDCKMPAAPKKEAVERESKATVSKVTGGVSPSNSELGKKDGEKKDAENKDADKKPTYTAPKASTSSASPS